MILDPRHGPRAGVGFTLIEVLAALLVLSLILAASFQGLSGSLMAVDASATHGRALSLARSRLDLLVTTASAGHQAQGEWAAAPGGVTYRWEESAVAYGEDLLGPGEAPGAELLEARVTVIWDAPRGTRDLSLTTLFPGTAQ